MKLDLDRIVLFGRTFGEYRRFFDLDEPVLRRGPVLDCAAGAASFTAEARAAGIEATACDPLYALSSGALAAKGEKDLVDVFIKFDEAADLYVWTFYRDKNAVMAARRNALHAFIEDFRAHPARYSAAGLPSLPFPDRTYSLVLVSHFLFLYGDRLDVDFHKAALKELMRVCSGELRVFPLVGFDAKPCPFLDDTQAFLAAQDYRAEIVPVPFEFQRGANKMLSVKRG